MGFQSGVGRRSLSGFNGTLQESSNSEVVEDEIHSSRDDTDKRRDQKSYNQTGRWSQETTRVLFSW